MYNNNNNTFVLVLLLLLLLLMWGAYRELEWELRIMGEDAVELL